MVPELYSLKWMDLEIMAPWWKQKKSWNSNNENIGESILSIPRLTEHEGKGETRKLMRQRMFAECRQLFVSICVKQQRKGSICSYHFCLSKAVLHPLNLTVSGILIEDSSLWSCVLHRTIVWGVGEGSKWFGLHEYFLLFLLWKGKAMDWPSPVAVLDASSLLIWPFTYNWRKSPNFLLLWTTEKESEVEKRRERKRRKKPLFSVFILKTIKGGKL